MGSHRWARALACTLIVLASARTASADPFKNPISVKDQNVGSITFSRLVVRLTANRIGVDDGNRRVQFIEALRRLGYQARGAESLVFERDDSDDARFVLGGTASELQCRTESTTWQRCWLGITWELLDRKRDRVTYRAHTRHAADGDSNRIAHETIWGNYYSLLSRPAFVNALREQPSQSQIAKPSFAPAKYLRCARPDAAMPAAAETLMQATVIVRAGDRLGSGTLISADGFVLTAAHVVDGHNGNVEIQTRGGPKIAASIIRVNRRTDVAVLKTNSGSDYPCVSIRSEPATTGEDLFAIGSPLGNELSFTLTRGVVSGVRKIDDISLVQTDASINRGNSGGPLLDSKGKLLGVISFKVVESGVEGIAFGVSMQSALTGLALEPADQTDPVLSKTYVAATSAPDKGVDDVPDQVPLLWQPPPRVPAAPPPPPAKPRGPKTSKAKRIGYLGLIAAGAGAVGVGVTYALYAGKKDTLRQDGFDNLRLANDISWVVTLGGAATFGLSELLPRERLPDKPLPTKKKSAHAHATLSVGIGPGMAVLRGTY